jgi:GNAT superfamily N-acetyltransferase
MPDLNNDFQLVELTHDNLDAEGIYCIKDSKSEGSISKRAWYKKEFEFGLKIFIAKNHQGKQIGFIEAVPAEFAWRPVSAPELMFIQCLVVFSKEFRNAKLASALIRKVEEYAIYSNKKGLCTLSSNGPWMANSSVFLKNEFEIVDILDRFELCFKAFDLISQKPRILDFESKQKDYNGWHLLYSNQCPWHQKSVHDLKSYSIEIGLHLNVYEIRRQEAQQGPSGFGTFSLLHNGKLLADHYISKTRFASIVKKVLDI